jgi:hypothetical protein
MGFVRQADLERHRAGSMEARLAAVGAAAAGLKAAVLAVHEDYALVRAEDGAVRRMRYALAEGCAVTDVVLEEADVPVLEGRGLDKAAGGDLRAAAAALMQGEPMGRTRVRDLARMLRREVPYWVPEAVAACVREDAPWAAWYGPQGAGVRERLHGQIREIEAPVPRTRYAKLADSTLAGCEAELRESVGVLRGVARTMVDDLTQDVAYQETELTAVHQSLREDARTLDEGLAWVAELDWTGAVPMVATAHDRIAVRLRDGLVVQAHLRAQTRSEQ